jgi:hypothetical protein
MQLASQKGKNVNTYYIQLKCRALAQFRPVPRRVIKFFLFESQQVTHKQVSKLIIAMCLLDPLCPNGFLMLSTLWGSAFDMLHDALCDK